MRLRFWAVAWLGLNLVMSALFGQAMKSGGPLENDIVQRSKPYVVLISLDGFGADLLEREKPKHLFALRESGAAAGSLLPVYPTTSFPNHMSIITGMYPTRHGIVDNNFHDRQLNLNYNSKTKAIYSNPAWYKGKPLWISAEEQGMRTACLFWPSSDVEIHGRRPTQYFAYDAAFPYRKRADQILEWLKLPAEQRPHLISAYFSLVDEVAHAKGPFSAEVADAVRQVDDAIGYLRAQLSSLSLPVNLIVVSDHGMQPIQPEPIDITRYADLTKFKISPSGGHAMFYSDDQAYVDETVRKLRNANDPRIQVYRRSELPERYHYRDPNRIGDIVVVAQTNQLIRSRPMLPGAVPAPPQASTHGFDLAKFPLMQGIFMAVGPNVKQAVRLESFENIHVYPFVARMLGLSVPADIDGKFSVLEPAYQSEP
jgi:predicted AlkP superfamily pyrophosphatase or phosphodiesterase